MREHWVHTSVRMRRVLAGSAGTLFVFYTCLHNSLSAFFEGERERERKLEGKASFYRSEEHSDLLMRLV